MTVCNVRQMNGPLRCEADFAHEGDHWAIVNKKHIRWENRLDKPTRALDGRTAKRRRMRQVSEPQQIDTDVVTGIMAERVLRRLNNADDPGFFCECPLVTGEPCPEYIHGPERDPQYILDNWHPHHIEKRRKGPKANRHNVFRSRSRPDNIAIVRPTCHDRIERNAPEWSKESAS